MDKFAVSIESFLTDQVPASYLFALDAFAAYVQKASWKICAEYNDAWFKILVEKGVGRVKTKALECINLLLATTECFEQSSPILLKYVSHEDEKIKARGIQAAANILKDYGEFAQIEPSKYLD